MLEYLGSVDELTIEDVPKDYHTSSIRKFFVKNQTKLDDKVIEEQKKLEKYVHKLFSISGHLQKSVQNIL